MVNEHLYLGHWLKEKAQAYKSYKGLKARVSLPMLQNFVSALILVSETQREKFLLVGSLILKGLILHVLIPVSVVNIYIQYVCVLVYALNRCIHINVYQYVFTYK